MYRFVPNRNMSTRSLASTCSSCPTARKLRFDLVKKQNESHKYNQKIDAKFAEYDAKFSLLEDEMYLPQVRKVAGELIMFALGRQPRLQYSSQYFTRPLTARANLVANAFFHWSDFPEAGNMIIDERNAVSHYDSVDTMQQAVDRALKLFIVHPRLTILAHRQYQLLKNASLVFDILR